MNLLANTLRIRPSSTPLYSLRWVRVGIVTACLLLSACTEPPSQWSEAERGLLRSLSLQALGPPPAVPSNRVSDDPNAAALGESLFFDTRLSGNGTLSCASCHQPERLFTDGRVKGQGVNTLARNTPTVIGGAWQTWFYWDGRRDSLWSQALIPIEAPDEMGGSRLAAARLMAEDADYARAYSLLFGPLPPVLTTGTLPAHAGEFADEAGRNAWFQLPKPTRDAINTVYANVGKSIAAYERTLTPSPSPFDRFVETLMTDGEDAASTTLDVAAQRGAKLFINVAKTRCLQCHNGPFLTNGDFHNIGTGRLQGSGLGPSEALDFGRMLGVQAVLLDPFNCLGPYSDAAPDDCSALRFLSKEQHGDTVGAYKTPPLRNAASTAPYFHDGRFATLREVLDHYNAPPASAASELVALDLSDQELDDLVAFLRALSSRPAE